MLSRGAAKSTTSKRFPAEEDLPDAPVVPAVEEEITAAASEPAGSVPESAWTSSVSRETPGTVDGAEFRSIPVASIVPNPRQPRQEFDEEHMDELVHSIREIGVLQPIVVRPAGPGQFELVMGERRWRASKAAERETVPAIVRMTADDDLLRDALLENIHRSQLNPLEEAAAYRQLLDDFNCTQDELSERIGRSRPQISNTLRLMKLPPAVQRRVAAGVLSAGHARALLGLKSLEQMDQLAGRIVAEGLSVRATEEAVTLAQRDQGTGDLGRERAKSPRVRQLEEFSDALTDRLDTQVKITLGAKKGRIAIDFGSIDDLHRLMEMIGSRS
ncbi:ParB/RepB/Spo0J family partition protein [Nesterenkonia sp. E16_10]|uniref:ParB/RepB/Spo0J family partition protein n=1 Tax=unclassified Nesterenkonia TaxID=2629769 RepID=UPI0031F67F0F